LTKQDRSAPKFPDLLKRDFSAPAPNVKWCGDMTEIPTDEGKLSALYDAMFTRGTRLRFGPQDSAAPLSTAYAELRAAAATITGERDIETLTEVLWAALHGLTTLSRNDRLRPHHDTERLDLLLAQFHATDSRHRSTRA